MLPKRRKQIYALAERVRTRFTAGDIPVPIDTLIANLGGEVRTVPFEQNQSEAMVRPGRAGDEKGPRFVVELIAYDESDYGSPEQRRRFTLAHELGHVFIHLRFDPTRPDPIREEFRDDRWFRRSNGQAEDDANEFAAALLMPETAFRERWSGDGGNDEARVTAAATTFNVSRQAARWRAKWLGLMPW